MLKLRNDLRKGAGFKINKQKLVVFLHTNNELSKKELKKTISFTLALKKDKIPKKKFNF